MWIETHDQGPTLARWRRQMKRERPVLALGAWILGVAAGVALAVGFLCR